MKPELERKPYEVPGFTHWGSLQALTAGDQTNMCDSDETGDDDPADAS